MKFEPKSEQEVQEANLLQPGIYDFEVTSAEDKISNKGNDMAVLKLKIEGEDGREMIVVDYLVAIDSMAYKLRHFAESVGLLEEYEKGEMVAEDMEDRAGRCKLGIEPQRGEYRAKNKVLDYLPADGAAPSAATLEDDSIPF